MHSRVCRLAVYWHDKADDVLKHWVQAVVDAHAHACTRAHKCAAAPACRCAGPSPFAGEARTTALSSLVGAREHASRAPNPVCELPYPDGSRTKPGTGQMLLRAAGVVAAAAVPGAGR